MKYYLFKECMLARSNTGELGKYEWLINGEWREDTDMSRTLNDVRVGYGDCSVFDYEDITTEIAEELIKSGTTILQVYNPPKRVHLSNWKKLTE